jgi:hypothetical protein
LPRDSSDGKEEGKKEVAEKERSPSENTRVEDDYPSPEPITPLLLGLRRKRKRRPPFVLLSFFFRFLLPPWRSFSRWT